MIASRGKGKSGRMAAGIRANAATPSAQKKSVASRMPRELLKEKRETFNVDNPTTFGEDARGEIYVGNLAGQVYKLSSY